MTCRAVIDESACLAHGDCQELAPHVFRVEEVATIVGTAPAEQLISIAEECPAGAISVVDGASGERIYP